MPSDLMPLPTLHIVSFNNPSPPNYGGVIDVYYKAKALHQLGINMVLHCFLYNRPKADELLDFCQTVYYYDRQLKTSKIFSTLPFIVNTRKPKSLLDNLSNDRHPVLLEGLHCCAFIEELRSMGRTVAVRTHNIEHHYYSHLAKASTQPRDVLYFAFEAIKLKRFEPILTHASHIFTISPSDQTYFQAKYGNSYFIPAFHPYFEPNVKPGRGKYLLIHGNLSVAENEKSILYLLKEIIVKAEYPVIVTGQNPSANLTNALSAYPNVQLVPNPLEAQLDTLLQNAQIILLHSHQPTGIKLKLLSSLYQGRHIICNKNIVSNTRLESLCNIVESTDDWRNAINRLWTDDIDDNIINQRIEALNKDFNNKTNANKIKSLLFNQQNDGI